jgi:hypothetical protein
VVFISDAPLQKASLANKQGWKGLSGINNIFSRIFVKVLYPWTLALHFVQDHAQIIIVFQMPILSF